jgi:hypothetical protein
MKKLIKTLIKSAIAVALLSTLSACAGTHTSPNMIDYSYVPHASSYTSPGIESELF